MLEQDKLIRDIAKAKKMDSRLVKAIAYYPLKFAKDRMTDISDDRPIRIRYFGAFVHKHMQTKKFKYETRASILIENIEDVAIMMATILGFQLVNFNSAKKIIEDSVQQKDYEKIKLIWDEWESYRTEP